MENYDRSRSYAAHNSSSSNNMQLQAYYGGGGPPYDLRCYSYSASYAQRGGGFGSNSDNKDRDFKLKKVKSTSGSSSNSWTFADPEFQRKRRVASYKMYGVEGKVKGSFRKSFRWLKDRYSQVVYGWW